MTQNTRLPDFLILGAMRCGSTTLANLLNTQKSIFIPADKELHYFDGRNPLIKSVQDYAGFFSSAAEGQLAGEATPDYYSTPGCAENIYSALPDVKLVVILRDPVARAWSHYRFSVASLREIEPFDVALELESERLAHPIHEHDIYFSYKQRGRYIEHIQTYMSRFNRDQLHIVFLEELIRDAQATMDRLFGFLNLEQDNDWKDSMRISNQASLVNILPDDELEQSRKRELKTNRNLADMLNARRLRFIPQALRDSIYRKAESIMGHSEQPQAQVKAYLEQYYKPYNQQLEQFLQRAVPW